jgi:hypothetical protein
MDKVQKHNSFNTNTPLSESYKNDLFISCIGYGLDDRGSFPGRGSDWIVSSPPRPDQFWSPSTLLSNGNQGAIFLGVKQPAGEADHSPPSSSEVKNEWSYTSAPQYVFMASYSVKQRNLEKNEFFQCKKHVFPHYVTLRLFYVTLFG